MNKKAQPTMDWEELIKLIIVLPILLVIIGAVFGVVGELTKQCPTCEDCSVYKNNLINLSQNLEFCKNNSKEIIYLNQTLEIPNEKPEFIDSPPVVYIIIEVFLILILSFTISFSLFEIKLPEKINKIIEKYEWIIKWFKIGSVIVSILIFLRLCWIFLKLF